MKFEFIVAEEEIRRIDDLFSNGLVQIKKEEEARLTLKRERLLEVLYHAPDREQQTRRVILPEGRTYVPAERFADAAMPKPGVYQEL